MSALLVTLHSYSPSTHTLRLGSTDPESPRLREMIQNQYIEIHDLSGNTFGNSCVYVRKCSVT